MTIQNPKDARNWKWNQSIELKSRCAILENTEDQDYLWQDDFKWTVYDSGRESERLTWDMGDILLAKRPKHRVKTQTSIYF